MKFTLLTALAASATLLQVSASPLRVVVVTTTTNQDLPSNFRFGHAVPHNANSNSNHDIAQMLVRPDGKLHKPCRGARMRQKAIDMSNAFRKALGWPQIEPYTKLIPAVPAHAPEPGRVHILPFVGTPNIHVEEDTPVPRPSAIPDRYLAHPRPGRGRVSFRHRLRNAPFLERLHVALMALGPWEGRAVAFVLGCGIGVLLRMLWVLAVVSYRLAKGPREEDGHRYTEILVVEEYDDAEEVAPAPPTYTFDDEKADKDNIVAQ
ncbi:hypothetical protein D9615_002683 [Tricholomella constricta]|uniref:Uncharacterized protein n=1 Tax=Tricholomella constricta TaxID=117010 RepID=A0A8H5M9M2_9AGAR|nr:hypothetical protein D9615_002683 [Tricholomella constricta]